MSSFTAILLCSLIAFSAASASAVQLKGAIRDWTVLGPLPNPERKAESRDRGAFDLDYLKPIGGETRAKITAESVITVTDADGKSIEVKAVPVSVAGESLDFCKHYIDTDHRLAYAYSEIVLPSDQEALFFLGSDDGAKVIVNGRTAFETLPPGGRAFTPRADRFKVKLHGGTNTVLVKVENGTGGWQFGLEAYVGEDAKKIEAELKNEENKREFQRQEVGLAGTWPGYVFWPQWGGVPRIVWRDIDRVRELVGEVPLKVRWFDAGLNEVKEPKEVGRYAAYIEGKLSDGTPVKRAMTFYLAPEAFDPWADWSIEMPYLGRPIDPAAWKEISRQASESAAAVLKESLILTQGGAITVAGVCEYRANGGACTFTESPEVINDDFHLKLKLKLAKLDGKTRSLAPPKDRSSSPARVLRAGNPSGAGMKADAKEKIDAVCRKWAEESGEPFSILVARHGVVVTHEAFGKTADGTPVTTDYRTQVASITKAISGMLFSRFVDQGFVKIDDPVGRFLPDFPTKGEHALTFRHLFTHTSALEGHGEWGGMHNPCLDNVILNGLDYIHPGRSHIYNGMGYDLAGKAMEMMSGKSIFRLFHEDLFRPMGIKEVPMSDMAFGARLTSYELGMLGQWLANHGSYGDKQFISEETFQKLLPEPLSRYYPGVDVEWGIGLTWFKEQKPGSKDLIFGEHVIGHGSATSCILRVDLDHDLVIAQVRRTAGEKFGEYQEKFFMAVADALE